MALFDKYYMQTPERKKAEKNGVVIDSVLQFADMGINPAFIRLAQAPYISLQARNNL